MMLGPIQFNDMYCGPRGSWWAVISSFSATCPQIGASCPPYSRGEAIVSQVDRLDKAHIFSSYN
jgi:hypothetical protein